MKDPGAAVPSAWVDPPDLGGELPAALVADLQDWSLHLQAGSFTQASVSMLQRDLARAVPSALGYTLRLVALPRLPEVSITVTSEPLPRGRIASSLTFDLPMLQGAIGSATFYAGEVAAFDRMAALLADGSGSRQVTLTGALDLAVVPGVQGMADYTRVNYAIGVLLGRGYSLAEADEHLATLARRHGSVEQAAAHLLATF